MIYLSIMDKFQPTSFTNFKKKALADPAIKKEYDKLAPEFEIIEDIICRRMQLGLTQRQLAKKIGTKQSSVSRLESGDYNPSLSFLKKVATGLEVKLRVMLE